MSPVNTAEVAFMKVFRLPNITGLASKTPASNIRVVANEKIPDHNPYRTFPDQRFSTTNPVRPFPNERFPTKNPIRTFPTNISQPKNLSGRSPTNISQPQTISGPAHKRHTPNTARSPTTPAPQHIQLAVKTFPVKTTSNLRIFDQRKKIPSIKKSGLSPDDGRKCKSSSIPRTPPAGNGGRNRAAGRHRTVRLARGTGYSGSRFGG